MPSPRDDRGPEGKGWLVAWVVCRMCKHRHVSVYPAAIMESIEDNQECPKCHNMTCEPVEYIKPPIIDHDANGKVKSE